MKRFLYLMLLFAIDAGAQNTSVTATVTDSDSISWANGTINFQLVNPSSQITPTCGGTVMTQAQLNVSYSLDAAGSITSQPVCSTDSIVPATTTWRTTICSNTSAPCQSLATQKITGGTLNMTTTIANQIVAIRLPASPSTRAYADIEIQPVPISGATYYNVTSATTKVWNGSSWTTQGGGGGVGVGSVWQREGMIISPPITDDYVAEEPSLLYEGNAQVLNTLQGGLATGNVFKLWWTCGLNNTGLCYAESLDGQVWTRSANPVIAKSNPGPAHGYVFHYNGTYYYYGGIGNGSSTTLNIWTSSNGISWTQTHTNILPLGTAGQWDSLAFANVFIVPSAGTWYMMYEAWGNGASIFLLGTATSSDQGVTWTKNPANPVLHGPSGGESQGPEIHLINNVYYVWYGCNNITTFYTPTDICRAHSTDFVTWTPDDSINPVFTRMTADEGAGESGGQIADPSMVQVGNNVYMIYDGVNLQTTSPDGFNLKLAIAPYTFAQLIQTNEGSSTSIHSGGGFTNFHLFPCVYWDFFGPARVPCPSTGGNFNIGLEQIVGGNQYSGINTNVYFNGTSNIYAENGSALSSYLDIPNNLYHFQMAPSGTAGGGVTFTDTYTISPTNGLAFPSRVLFNNPTFGANVFNSTTNGYAQIGWAGSAATPVWQTGVGNVSESGLGVANKFFFYNTGGSFVAASFDNSSNFEIGRTGVLPTTFSKLFNIGTTGQFTVDTGGNTVSPSVKTTVYTVATLPSAATLGAGAQVTVSDATTFTPGTCTGGGSDYMIAVSNGTTWSCH